MFYGRNPMPKGPQGQKRPGDVVGAAIMVAKIVTSDVEDNATARDKAHHGRGGKRGGAARASDDETAARSQDFLYDGDGLPS